MGMERRHRRHVGRRRVGGDAPMTREQMSSAPGSLGTPGTVQSPKSDAPMPPRAIRGIRSPMLPRYVWSAPAATMPESWSNFVGVLTQDGPMTTGALRSAPFLVRSTVRIRRG